MNRILLTGSALTCADVAAVAIGAGVELSAQARAAATASHAVASRAARIRPLYGWSTGVGANREQPIGAAGQHQLDLLRSHAASAGRLRSSDRVRALLAVRLNQLAAGGSGIHPSVLDGLAGMINADALPQIRELGGVGTSDLPALATIALALLGESSTTHPLPRHVDFGAGDGLAFLSSNAGCLADTALALDRLNRTAGAAVVIAAISFVALNGNAEAFDPSVGLATPFAGARETARRLRELIAGPRPPARIQDPFSLRTLPQTLGPLLDALAEAERVVTALINAPAENPLFLATGNSAVSAAKAAHSEGAIGPAGPGHSASSAGSGGAADTVIHHGGFQAGYLQLAADTAAVALARSAVTGLGRLSALLDPRLTGLPAFLADGPPGSSGLMICEYLAAAALGEIRAAAVPAGVQTATLSLGAEEDASFATLAAGQLLGSAEHHHTLLACELLAAVRAMRMSGREWPPGLQPVRDRCAGLPGPGADRDLTAELDLATGMLDEIAAVAGSGS